MGVPTGLGDPANAPIPKFRDYFEKFEAVFGRERLMLSDFAAEDLFKNDIRLDFLLKIGISETHEFRLSENRTNESLSAEAIMIAQAMIKLFRSNYLGNLFFTKYNEFLGSIKGSPLYLSDEEK